MPYSAHIVPAGVDDRLTVTIDIVDHRQAVVRLEGELDLGNATYLADVLDDELHRGRHVVTVDLSRITFVNSAGLRVLAMAHNHYLRSGGRLVLSGVGPRTARLLSITRLDTALTVVDVPTGLPPRHLTSVASTTSPRRASATP